MTSLRLKRALMKESAGAPFHLVGNSVPRLRRGHVLVRFMARGVNPRDTKMRQCTAAHTRQTQPAVLGTDMAGVVESLAEDATRLRSGDWVYGMSRGIGHVAEQIARARGAPVFATGTQAQFPLIERFGAVAIDFKTATVTEYVDRHLQDEGFGVVFDTVGGATLDASFEAVRRCGGHVVSALGWGTHKLAPLSFRAATYFDWDSAVDAHQLVEGGLARGKVVVGIHQ